MMFPVRKKIIAIIVSLHANGNSSYRDAQNLRDLTKKTWNENGRSIILTDNIDPFNDTTDIYLVKNKNEFLIKLTDVVTKYSEEYDILFTISAHGYSLGEDEFIRVRNDKVIDYEIRDALYNQMHVFCHSFCLVDTCHSGSMLDLPWQSENGLATMFKMNKEKDAKNLCWNSYCISACNDIELSGEDVSNFGGWGGRLIGCFLDYVVQHNTERKYTKIHIINFYKYVYKLFVNAQYQKSHPVFSRT